jgi:hypothetical protein
MSNSKVDPELVARVRTYDAEMSKADPVVVYSQAYRDELVARVRACERSNVEGAIVRGASFVKIARILALRIAVPFIVHTDRGPMRGEAGDWLATNHPDDDPGSDLWTISDERMAATYQVVPPRRDPTMGAVAGVPVPYLDMGPK